MIESRAFSPAAMPISPSPLRSRSFSLEFTRYAATSSRPEPTRLTVGDLVVDLLTREVTRGGRIVDLQKREFALLEHLARNVGRPVSKRVILQHVVALDFAPPPNVVEVLISRLRSKIDAESPQKMIHTVRGIGYVLRAS